MGQVVDFEAYRKRRQRREPKTSRERPDRRRGPKTGESKVPRSDPEEPGNQANDRPPE